ncbi:MAG: hypothetical protein ABJN22_11860 [Litorimonas sp.]
MNAIDVCSLERWNTLCLRLGIAADGETYSALISAHAEKHRAYHTLDHIAACLRHLDDVQHRLKKPEEVEMSLWFHDAIYEPFSATNEDDSAEWAADWLQERGAAKPVIARIADHILNTKSHDTPESVDGQYMLDIDLSILGTSPEIYDEFELNIRREYRRVPGFIFRKKRKAILQGFLDRENIYATEYFREKLEKTARINLVRAVSQL